MSNSTSLTSDWRATCCTAHTHTLSDAQEDTDSEKVGPVLDPSRPEGDDAEGDDTPWDDVRPEALDEQTG